MLTAQKINTLEFNPELCIGCKMCLYVCPHAVFAQDNTIVKMIHPEACMECGACQVNCPTLAIQVESGVGCAAAMMAQVLLGGNVPVGCGCVESHPPLRTSSPK